MYNTNVEPTEKQIEFIRVIQAQLGRPFNYDGASRRDASLYITKHIKAWRKAVKDKQNAEAEHGVH